MHANIVTFSLLQTQSPIPLHRTYNQNTVNLYGSQLIVFIFLFSVTDNLVKAQAMSINHYYKWVEEYARPETHPMM